MRRACLQAGQHRVVLRHEPRGGSIESLDDHARQYRVELGAQDLACLWTRANRRIEERELVAAPPILAMLLRPIDDEREDDGETVQAVRARPVRLEAYAVGSAVAGEIERPGTLIPGRRRCHRHGRWR